MLLPFFSLTKASTFGELGEFIFVQVEVCHWWRFFMVKDYMNLFFITILLLDTGVNTYFEY